MTIKNPSFCIKPDGNRWRCWGCGLNMAMPSSWFAELNPGWTFPEAVAYLAGKPAPSGKPTRPRPPAASQPAKARESPPGNPRGCPWPMP